jgi:hypothetical protein
MIKLFTELGGYKNGFGYMEILNPKKNVLNWRKWIKTTKN